MTAPTPNANDIALQDQIIELLPNDPQHALWTLARLVETFTYSIDESLEDFLDRILAYRDMRP